MSAVRLQPGRVQVLPLSAVIPDPDQPRKTFAASDLKSLSESIKADGIIRPLLVRKSEGGKWTLVDGERRWRAAEKLGLKTVPVQLWEGAADALAIRTAQATLNDQHEKLSPMDRARMLAGMQTRDKLSPKLIADRMSQRGMKISKQDVEMAVRLLELPTWAQAWIDEGKLDAAGGAAMLPAIAPHPMKAKLLEALKDALDDHLNYGGELLPRDVTDSLGAAYASVGTDLTRVNAWDGAKVVYFAWEKTCVDCQHLRKSSRGAYCLSEQEFSIRNAAAKAAGLLPGGKKPKAAPKSEAEAKALDLEERAEGTERRAQSRAGRLREYFDAWLRAQLALRAWMPSGRQLAEKLADYVAAGMPEKSPGADHPLAPPLKFGLADWGNRARIDAARSALAPKLSRQSLADFLAGPRSLEEMTLVAEACLQMLQPHQVLQVAKWAQIDVESSYRIDEGYVGPMMKAELRDLAVLGAGIVDDLPRTAVGLREALLLPENVQKIGLPADLRAIWEADPIDPAIVDPDDEIDLGGEDDEDDEDADDDA